MQLKTDVLPAPFGPMMANSSSRRCASGVPTEVGDGLDDTAVVSAIGSRSPALAPAVGLDVAERATLRGLADAQVELADVLVGQQVGARAVPNDPTVLEHVAVVGDRQGHGGVLLDEQDAGPLGVDVDDDAADLGAHQRGP